MNVSEALALVMEGMSVEEAIAALLEFQGETGRITKHSVPGVSLLRAMKVKPTKVVRGRAAAGKLTGTRGLRALKVGKSNITRGFYP